MNSKSFYWRTKFIRHDIIILTNENKDFRNEYWKQGNRCYMVFIYPKSGMGHLPLNLKRLSEILRRLSVYYKMLVSVFNTLSQFWLTVRPVLRNLGFYPRYKIGVVFFTRSQMNDSNMTECSLLGRKFACSSFKWLVNIMHAYMVPRDIVTTLYDSLLLAYLFLSILTTWKCPENCISGIHTTRRVLPATSFN